MPSPAGDSRRGGPHQAALQVIQQPPRLLQVVARSGNVAISELFEADIRDWPKLRLIGNVTSGLAGTFFAELRGRRSLAYTVFATDASRKDAGAFMAYLATEASKESDARAGLLGEIRRLQTDGITAEDVDRARKYFAGSTRIGLQTSGSILEDYAGHQFYGLGLDWTDRLLATTATITLDDLKAVSAKYLSTENFVTAVQRGKAK